MPETEEPQGPGLKRQYQRIDPVSTTSIICAVIGLVPTGWIRIANFEGFGPIAFPAIFAIVAVLFGFLAVFRHGELQDKRALIIGSIGAGLGVVRLFVYPLFGL